MAVRICPGAPRSPALRATRGCAAAGRLQLASVPCVAQRAKAWAIGRFSVSPLGGTTGRQTSPSCLRPRNTGLHPLRRLLPLLFRSSRARADAPADPGAGHPEARPGGCPEHLASSERAFQLQSAALSFRPAPSSERTAGAGIYASRPGVPCRRFRAGQRALPRGPRTGSAFDSRRRADLFLSSRLPAACRALRLFARELRYRKTKSPSVTGAQPR